MRLLAGGGVDLILAPQHVLAAPDLVAVGHVLVGDLPAVTWSRFGAA
jgi:hypothetical protein